MNTLKIEIPYDKLDFIDACTIKWEINSKKSKKTIIRYIIAATIVLGIGIIAHYDKDPNNPAIYLGIIFELFAFLLANIMIVSKRKYKNDINELAEKYDKIKMDCVYEFSDESIKYWDKEKHIELKWEVFTSYSIYKKYILININDSFISSYIFNENGLDTEEFARIYEFVESKLKLKAIIKTKEKKGQTR